MVGKEKRELEFQLLVQRSEGHELDSGRELTRLAEEFLRDMDSGFVDFIIEEKRELIRKSVAQLIVDPQSNRVNCTFGRPPYLPPYSICLRRSGKSKKATFLESPFRNIEVAGTRTFFRSQPAGNFTSPSSAIQSLASGLLNNDIRIAHASLCHIGPFFRFPNMLLIPPATASRGTTEMRGRS